MIEFVVISIECFNIPIAFSLPPRPKQLPTLLLRSLSSHSIITLILLQKNIQPHIRKYTTQMPLIPRQPTKQPAK